MQSTWMLAASLLFAVMGACVKLASDYYGVAELVLYRGLFGVVAIAVYVRLRGQSLATEVPWMHLRRGAIGTASLSLWFFATTILPLGTATALNYTSSLFLAAFTLGAALRARRGIDATLLGSVALGFAGVLLVLQPSFTAEQWFGALAGLLSGLLSAMVYWHVRELSQRGEPEWRIVFYFSVAGLALGLLGSLMTGFSAHRLPGVALLLAIGATALLAQLAMTRAYGRGRALLTANLQFSTIVFASILGVLVFADHIPLAGWLGMTVIIASGLLATWAAQRRTRARLSAPLTLSPP